MLLIFRIRHHFFDSIISCFPCYHWANRWMSIRKIIGINFLKDRSFIRKAEALFKQHFIKVLLSEF